MKLIQELGDKDLGFAQVICGKDGDEILPYKFIVSFVFTYHVVFKAELGLHLITATKTYNEIDIKIFEIVGIDKHIKWQEVTYSDKFNKAHEAVKTKLNDRWGNRATYYRPWCSGCYPNTLLKDGRYFCTKCRTFIGCEFCSYDNICEFSTIYYEDMYICVAHLEVAKEVIEDSTY